MTAVSVLGGFMAGFSGYAASKAVPEQASPEVVGRELNEGLALGFDWGAVAAAIVFLVIIGI